MKAARPARPSELQLLGLDIGTSAVKAALFTVSGVNIAAAATDYPTTYLGDGRVEQDPADWWVAACTAVHQVIGQATSGTVRIAAVCVSAQAPTLLALDEQLRPLRPALIWMDRRSGAECASLARELGPGYVEHVTGNRLDPFFVAPKIRWLRANEPGTLRRTHIFAQINGYIALRLTGCLSMDEQHASLLGLRSWDGRAWDDRLLNAVGASRDQFPPVRLAAEVIGEVTKPAAAETGLSAGTPVVAGSVDSAVTALEAGVVDEGQAVEMTGTSTVIVLPATSRRHRTAFISMASAVPGRDLLLAAMVASGGRLRWLRDTIAPQASFTELACAAARAIPGAQGLIFLPYMMGERSPVWDSNARGVFLGLSLRTGQPELVRGVLEGTAHALRHNLDLAASAGLHIGELLTVGGGSASDVWCQIKADITGLPIRRLDRTAGAPFGDAILAGVGAGLFADARTAVRSFRVTGTVFEPRPELSEFYDQHHAVYLRSYESLQPVFASLAVMSVETT